MEEVLDRETKIEKTNSWVTIIVSNISIFFITFVIAVFQVDKMSAYIAGLGVIVSIFLNGIMTLILYFSSSSDWKKWAIVLAIIFTMILGAFLYLYLVITNW